MMVDNAEREVVVVVGEERKEDVERSAVRKTLVGAIFNLLGRRPVRVETCGVYRRYVFESPVRFERSSSSAGFGQRSRSYRTIEKTKIPLWN
jgi:hypothetical protein